MTFMIMKGRFVLVLEAIQHYMFDMPGTVIMRVSYPILFLSYIWIIRSIIIKGKNYWVIENSATLLLTPLMVGITEGSFFKIPDKYHITPM